MAAIPNSWIKLSPLYKHSPPPTADDTMQVDQRDIVAHMESLEVILACSSRSNPSRRNRPALPPEEERSSHTDEPG